MVAGYFMLASETTIATNMNPNVTVGMSTRTTATLRTFSNPNMANDACTPFSSDASCAHVRGANTSATMRAGRHDCEDTQSWA